MLSSVSAVLLQKLVPVEHLPIHRPILLLTINGLVWVVGEDQIAVPVPHQKVALAAIPIVILVELLTATDVPPMLARALQIVQAAATVLATVRRPALIVLPIAVLVVLQVAVILMIIVPAILIAMVVPEVRMLAEARVRVLAMKRALIVQALPITIVAEIRLAPMEPFLKIVVLGCGEVKRMVVVKVVEAAVFRLKPVLAPRKHKPRVVIPSLALRATEKQRRGRLVCS